jgi:DNA primase
MNFKGRVIDPLKLWEGYVELPDNPGEGPFLPLVFCPNPAHENTRTPAFQINVHQPTVHCFSRCGIEGSYQHAICVIHDLYDKYHVEEARSEKEQTQRRRAAYREARRIILRASMAEYKAGDSRRDRDFTAKRRQRSDKAASDLDYSRYLPQVGQDYLRFRGISAESIAEWELGWDEAEARLVIPAKDINGRTRCLIKRAVRPKDRPKYLYSEGFDKNSLLFGACQIDLGMIRSRGIVVVEGSLDCIVFHQFSLRNTVASLGTGISEKQARIIERLRPRQVYLFFDRDLAGVRGVEIAASYIRKVPLYVCRYPKHRYDPNELRREEAVRAIRRAMPYIWFKQQIKQQTRSNRLKGNSLGKST